MTMLWHINASIKMRSKLSYGLEKKSTCLRVQFFINPLQTLCTNCKGKDTFENQTFLEHLCTHKIRKMKAQSKK